MRLYQGQHRAYCGVDLHARTMFLCILDHDGRTLLHEDIPATKAAFLQAIAPHRDGLVVACECMFAWYWLADACQEHGIPFVLGHALDMRAIHGTKTKNDRIDSEKIAHLLRTGLLPQAYVYPAAMRATRDLLRRRAYLVRRRAEALTHVQIINGQYNLPAPTGKLRYAANRAGRARPLRRRERPPDPRGRPGPGRAPRPPDRRAGAVPRRAGQGARPADASTACGRSPAWARCWR